MSGENQPMAAVLAACAAELADLSQRCEALQAALSDSLASSAADAQGLDLITQTAAGLGQFLAALGAATPPDLLVDAHAAARELTLSDLARALTGRAREDADAGELDFFGA